MDLPGLVPEKIPSEEVQPNKAEKREAASQSREDLWRQILSLQIRKNADEAEKEKLRNLLKELMTQEPEDLKGWMIWVEALLQAKRYQEAEEALKKLAQRCPDDEALRWKRIQVLALSKRYEEALKELKPMAKRSESAEQHYLSGCLHGELGNWKNAASQFRKASQKLSKPILRWKHLQFFPLFWECEEAVEEGWNRLLSELDEALAEKPVYDWKEFAQEGFYPSFHLAHQGKCCREVKEKFSQLVRKTFSSQVKPFPRGSKKEKLRVGLFCIPGDEGGFFRAMQGIWEGLNPHRFQPILFVQKNRVPQWYAAPSSVNLVTYGEDFVETVEKIRETACDIFGYRKAAADLWSFSLPFLRMAPVQFTSWGTHGTSGMEEVDYYLTWDAAEIPDAGEHYTEKLYRMKVPPKLERPEYASFSTSASATREELGLPRRHAIYFCPHRWAKLHPKFDSYLRDILQEDSQGHLLLLGEKTSGNGEKLQQRMRKTIGEEAFRRVLFLPRLSPWLYRRYFSQATVLLDSCVYAGEWTCHDAFSNGVPSVTQCGNLLVQRYSTAHYQAMGIAQPPVTTCRTEYVRQAVRLGRDEAYREEVSRAIREAYPQCLGDTGVIQEYENFLEIAYQESCHG